MAVQGISARDFFDLARFAWATYESIKLSRQNFGNLNVDVECLLIGVSALNQGHTSRLVAEYIDSDPSLQTDIKFDNLGHMTSTTAPSVSQRQLEVRALRDGLHSVIFPFYVFLEKHTNDLVDPRGGESGNESEGARGFWPKGNPRSEPRPNIRTFRSAGSDPYASSTQAPDPQPNLELRAWNRLPLWVRRLYISFDVSDMGEIRSRLAVQAANLNSFLTRLTHMQLQKQTAMLTLRLAEDTLLDDHWEYSRDLKQGKAKFRQDVAFYVRHLLKGGMPFTEQELRRKGVEDDFTRQRKDDQKWAADKIAEEDKKRGQLERESQRRDEKEYDASSSRPNRYSPARATSSSTVQPSSTESRSGAEDRITEGQTRPGPATLRGRPYVNRSPRRTPLEASLSADALKALDEARLRLYRVDAEGVVDEYNYDDPQPQPRQQSLSSQPKYNVPAQRYDPQVTTPEPQPYRRRADTLTVDRNDPKRHSFPGIMVSPPTQYPETSPRTSKRFSSSSASPNGRGPEAPASPSTRPPPRIPSNEPVNSTTSTTSTTSSPRPPQSEPMQHSLSASPRVPFANPIRSPSTPTSTAATATTTPSPTGLSTTTTTASGPAPFTTASSDRPSINQHRRSPTRVLLCDQCNASIRLNEYFWRCPTGNCATAGRTYDLCAKCLDRGYRCRGTDQGTCDRMTCTIIKGAEP